MSMRIVNWAGDERHAGLRRLAVLAVVAAAAFLVSYFMSTERDWSGVTQARAMHEAVRAKRGELERLIERQPHATDAESAGATALRLATASEPDDEGDSPASQDPLWQLALAAHEQGLHIRHLAPAPGGVQGVRDEAEPRYDIAGDGRRRIGAIAGWVRSLAALPMAVVPVRLDIERQAASTTFSARLAVVAGRH